MPLRTTGLPACSQALTLHRAAVPYSPPCSIIGWGQLGGVWVRSSHEY